MKSWIHFHQLIVNASLLFALEKIGFVFGIVANARLYFPSIVFFNLNLNFDGTCPEILFRDETPIILLDVIITKTK